MEQSDLTVKIRILGNNVKFNKYCLINYLLIIDSFKEQ